MSFQRGFIENLQFPFSASLVLAESRVSSGACFDLKLLNIEICLKQMKTPKTHIKTTAAAKMKRIRLALLSLSTF